MLNKFGIIISALFITVVCNAQAPNYPTAPYVQQQFYPPAYGQVPVNPYQQPMAGYPQMAAAPRQAAPPKPKKPFREFSGYLGIATDILPSSVAAQLPEGFSQGILIKEFAPDSPANTSDLKPFDVLVAYAGKKIGHPVQFVKMVRDDTPGNQVVLKIIRKGQVKDISITLGSQKTPNPKEFNGLAIKQIGKNTYNALIRFIGANGNKQMRSYKGTREEIFEQALNAQDLPPAERQQLLFATRPRNNNGSNSGFGSFFPFGQNESGKDWMNPRRFFKW